MNHPEVQDHLEFRKEILLELKQYRDNIRRCMLIPITDDDEINRAHELMMKLALIDLDLLEFPIEETEVLVHEIPFIHKLKQFEDDLCVLNDFAANAPAQESIGIGPGRRNMLILITAYILQSIEKHDAMARVSSNN